MAQWGLEVFDEFGNLVIDNDSLLHRLWHVQEVHSEFDYIYYEEPLEHEPTVVIYELGDFVPREWDHLMDGDLYIGLILATIWLPPSSNLVVVYARR